MHHLSCEVQCKGFLEEDFLVQITDDTEDDSNILDLSEYVANNKCNDTKMVIIDSAFAERCGEYNEQIKLIKRDSLRKLQNVFSRIGVLISKKLKFLPSLSVIVFLSRTLITKV